MSAELLPLALQPWAGLRLSPFDNLRFCFSTLYHQGIECRAFEAKASDGKRHYLLEGDDWLLDCGVVTRTSAELVPLVSDEGWSELESLALVPVAESQLAFLTIQHAHFDHL
ncbi:hypothetical protein [Shewanella cyperi]|uniref:hypothetical protein n=1 Tax=Shewanella cyperi TaxID=2814292 RepID=UPI001A94E923|nr:hypothetical protein [Shewanella cyperi]QSX39999.1 hypothetical protein JYB84_13555 [Shewanella cyperi]